MRSSPAGGRCAAGAGLSPGLLMLELGLAALLSLGPIAGPLRAGQAAGRVPDATRVADRAAAQSVLEVRPAGTDRFTVEPRRTVTGIFSISNHAFVELDLRSRLNVPPGWNVVATDLAERMYGEDRAISLVSLHVPRTTRAGRYRITYSVAAEQDAALGDSCTIEVEVLPTVRLVLRPTETPDYVIAGDICEAYFALTNQGNTAAAVRLYFDAPGDLALSAEPPRLDVAAGETRRVRVVVATDPGARRRLTRRVTLVADTGEAAQRVAATIPVDIIPRISLVEDPYYRAPARLSLRYVGEGDGIAKSLVQAEVTGGGPVGETGSRQTSFHIIGPDSRRNGTLGKPDEYFFAYRTPSYEASLGDQSFSVSQLVEPGRYGFGARAEATAGDLNVRAYHMQTRWDQPRTEQTAATLDYQVSATGAVGVNYLSEAASGRSHVLGLEGRLQPVEGADIELEYSRGLSDPARGQAYRFYTRTAGKTVQWLFRTAHADADFPGYYSDVDFIASALTVTAIGDLRLGLGVRQESRNLGLDPNLGSAPQDRSLDINADYRLRPATDIFLGCRFQRHSDRSDSSAYRSDESSVRTGVTYRARRWDVHAGVEAGAARDLIAGRRGTLGRYALSANARPSDRQTYRAYLFLDSNSLDGDSRHATGGANAALRLAEGTSLDAGIKFDHFRHGAEHDRAILTAGLTQAMPRRATARLETYYGTHDSGATSDRFGLLCEVEVPIEVPLARRPDIGSLKGLVYDAETGEAVPDVILRLNGLTAVTNEDGRYAFPSVRAGHYALGLDRGTIGLSRTPVVRLPVDVDIQAGSGAVVDIGVTRSSQVRGRIELHAPARRLAGLAGAGADTAAGVAEYRGLAGAVVELSGGDETRYALTDQAGAFRFEDLRPGKWRLTVRADDLPEGTHLDSDALQFDLKPGEEAAASVRVLPQHRAIRMREEGGLIEETPARLK